MIWHKITMICENENWEIRRLQWTTEKKQEWNFGTALLLLAIGAENKSTNEREKWEGKQEREIVIMHQLKYTFVWGVWIVVCSGR